MINDGERVPVCLESTEFFRMKGEGMETEFILHQNTSNTAHLNTTI